MRFIPQIPFALREPDFILRSLSGLRALVSSGLGKRNLCLILATFSAESASMSSLRTSLTLSQPERLPTVWSNCLAGWWLGGGGNSEQLPLLFVGATLLYVGGAWLHAWLDIEHPPPEQPPPGLRSASENPKRLWYWALALLALGTLLLAWRGGTTAAVASALAFCVILYHAGHWATSVGPVLRGLCRFFLYAVGASWAARGVTGWALWSGLAMAAYVAGLGCFAQWEKRPARVNGWPLILMAVPIALAMLINADGYREPALLLSAVLVLWTLRALRPTFWSEQSNLPLTVARLAAGIVVVDWLAAGPVASIAGPPNQAPRELSFGFIGLLFATVLLQRAMAKPVQD
jgi:hypothetical protein